MNDINSDIDIRLRSVGLRATLMGFRYLSSAIALVLDDESYLHCLTTRLYPDVAAQFHVSPASVEHSMRTMVEVFWDREDHRPLEKILGYPLSRRPSTGEFIDLLSSSMK